MVRFSEIEQFPYFPQPFPGYFRTTWPRFEKFGIFGWMESAQCESKVSCLTTWELIYHGRICCGLILLFSTSNPRESVGGIVVSIAAFQAVDPGSIPGRRNGFSFFFFFFFLFVINVSYFLREQLWKLSPELLSCFSSSGFKNTNVYWRSVVIFNIKTRVLTLHLV